MKKILLGITALSSVASFGMKYDHLHGYLDLEGSVSVEKPIEYEKVNGSGGSGSASGAVGGKGGASNEMQIKGLWKQDDVTNKLGT
ncbi:hypothetical protein, partial [Streptobacillus notomytis]|uniref:hypothetical protein n=1 Tax=Streptobacillus notomytis TaxID=1712031 RepID=UPI00117FE03F